VYLLESTDQSYLYVGSTGNFQKRLLEHNTGLHKSTKPYIPLYLSAYVGVKSENNARSLEKYFKTGSGKVILKNRILQTETMV